MTQVRRSNTNSNRALSRTTQRFNQVRIINLFRPRSLGTRVRALRLLLLTLQNRRIRQRFSILLSNQEIRRHPTLGSRTSVLTSNTPLLRVRLHRINIIMPSITQVKFVRSRRHLRRRNLTQATTTSSRINLSNLRFSQGVIRRRTAIRQFNSVFNTCRVDEAYIDVELGVVVAARLTAATHIRTTPASDRLPLTW